MLEEREIDLIDLIADVLKHWKGAILWMLIGAICLGAYSYSRPVTVEEEEEELAYADIKAVDVALEYEELCLQAQAENDMEAVIALDRAVIDCIRTFTDEQMVYFVDNSKSDLWKGEIPELEDDKEEDNVVPERGVSKKLVLLGAVAFCMMYFFLWAVIYVLDSHVKASDDMLSLVNVPQLGRITTVKEPGFIIDKLLFRLKHHGQRIFTADKSVELLASNIAVNAKKKDITSITIVGCDLEKKSNEYCMQLADSLKNNHQVDANVLDDIVYNQEAVESLGASKSVVIVETVGNTLYSDLDKEVKLIQQLDIAVLGGVIVE